MPASIRKWVNELMIYDLDDDKLSSNEAANFLDSHKVGGWTVHAEGISEPREISAALETVVNIEQLSFCTHGFAGGVAFPRGYLFTDNLKMVSVPPSLFKGAGRLLFMGCDTARGKAGEDFLLAAGKHFFAGKGGIVGGATINNLGWRWGTRTPSFGPSGDGWDFGSLKLFQIDAKGSVIGNKTVRPRVVGLF